MLVRPGNLRDMIDLGQWCEVFGPLHTRIHDIYYILYTTARTNLSKGNTKSMEYLILQGGKTKMYDKTWASNIPNVPPFIPS